MANIGVVVVLTGQAIVISAQGIQRQLAMGDSIETGDTIIAPAGTTVELQLANGNIVKIGAQQSVTFTQELSDAILYNLVEPSDNAVSQATIQSVIQAINSGDNIDDIIASLAQQRTDVNEGASGAEQSGHNFVDLLRIDNVLNQFDYGYDVASREYLDTDPLQQDRDVQPNDANSGAVYLPRIDQDLNQFNFDFNRFNSNFNSRRDGDNLRQSNDPDYINGGKNGSGNNGGNNGGGNLAPVATAVAFVGAEDAPSIAIPLTGTDADGTITSIRVTGLPTTQGTLVYDDDGLAGTPPVAVPLNSPLSPLQAASIQFIPAPNFNGTLIIPFTVTDNSGATSPVANATITVSPQNDAPIAVNDSVPVTEDTPASGNVLTNDIDVDGDTLTVTQFTIPSVGTFTPSTTSIVIPGVGSFVMLANGSFTFTPAPNYIGVIPAITYTVSDGTATDTATLTLGPIVDTPEPHFKRQ